MDDKATLETINYKAHLCAIEAAVCALMASHPEPARLSKFFDATVSGMLSRPELSRHPGRRYFQLCLDRFRAILPSPDHQQL